jgi:hypothetical protein
LLLENEKPARVISSKEPRPPARDEATAIDLRYPILPGSKFTYSSFQREFVLRQDRASTARDEGLLIEDATLKIDQYWLPLDCRKTYFRKSTTIVGAVKSLCDAPRVLVIGGGTIGGKKSDREISPKDMISYYED